MKHEMVTRVEDITFRYSHHREAVKELVSIFWEKEGVIALVFGGSVAKHMERPDSDIDAMVVVTDDFYAKAKEENCTAGMIPMGDCAYPGGYFDYKYMAKDFIRDAAEKASEPTRNSFIGSHVMFSADPEVTELYQRSRYSRSGSTRTRCSPSSVICSSTISISGKSADRRAI